MLPDEECVSPPAPLPQVPVAREVLEEFQLDLSQEPPGLESTQSQKVRETRIDP